MAPPLRPPSDGGSCTCSKQRSTSCVFPAPALPATSVIPCTSMPPPSTRSSIAQPSESFRVWRMSSCRAWAVMENGALELISTTARTSAGAAKWQNLLTRCEVCHNLPTRRDRQTDRETHGLSRGRPRWSSGGRAAEEQCQRPGANVGQLFSKRPATRDLLQKVAVIRPNSRPLSDPFRTSA